MEILSFFYVLLLTGIRLGSFIYNIWRQETNLPIVVFVLTGGAIVYGIYLVLHQWFRENTLYVYRAFFVVDMLVTAFNLIYVALNVPLRIDFSEIVIVGSILEIVLNICFLYGCQRKIKREYVTVDLSESYLESISSEEENSKEDANNV